MTRRMQQMEFDRSLYERPNREWICGHTGHPCALGPDRQGECTTTHECVPARDGERWRCTRTSPFGGECARGPLPDGTCCNPVTACQPRRSLRAQRGRAIRIAAGLTVGFLALYLAGDGALEFVYPGPVTKHHGTLETECAQCHVAGEGGLAHWIAMALPGGAPASDAARCLECHDLGESELLPHSLPAETLATTRERLLERETESGAPLRVALASVGTPGGDGANAELACSTCHDEHQGVDHDLTALTNDQCQVCHVVQFDRFEEDHPALGLYPYGRRTRIVFDHATHFEEYFDDEEAGAHTCVTCHAPEPTGRTMDVNDFAISCGECHDGLVRSSGTSGIAFLNVPDLDTSGLRRSGFDPGQWPSIERGRAPSPFVSLLLAGDPRLAGEDTAELARAAANASSVGGLDPEDRARTGRYVWAMKTLLRDLRRDGQKAIAARANSEAIGAGALSDEAQSHLVGGLDRTAVARAVDTWFPDLEREVAIFERVTSRVDDLASMSSRDWARLNEALRARANERRGRSRASGGNSSGGERFVRQGGWYISGRDASLRYRSSGHADPFLRTWFDLASTVSASGVATSRAAAADLFDGLRGENATGACTECHSVDVVNAADEASTDSLRVAWAPHRPDPGRKRATEFRHVPHFSLDREGTCDACHALRDADIDAFEEAYEDEAEIFGHALNFEPIGRDLCGSCHTREAAGDDCVACHNYHLGTTTPIHLTATMRASDPPEIVGDPPEEEAVD